MAYPSCGREQCLFTCFASGSRSPSQRSAHSCCNPTTHTQGLEPCHSPCHSLPVSPTLLSLLPFLPSALPGDDHLDICISLCISLSHLYLPCIAPGKSRLDPRLLEVARPASARSYHSGFLLFCVAFHARLFPHSSFHHNTLCLSSPCTPPSRASTRPHRALSVVHSPGRSNSFASRRQNNLPVHRECVPP